MKKKKILLFGWLILFNILIINAQEISSEHNSVLNKTTHPSLSVFNLHPQLLNKGKIMVQFRADFPHYYKVYNPQFGKVGKISDKVVMSESFFNTYGTYGLSDKWNLFVLLPIADVHHYSPMGIVSGVGLSDVCAGADYQIKNLHQDHKNSLAARITLGFPTGSYKNLGTTDYPIGLGSFSVQGALTGLRRYQQFDMIYSVYYEYRTNHSGKQIGDETGLYLALQKGYQTEYGNFGLEGGLNSYWNFSDKQNGQTLPNSEDTALNVYVSAWYQYFNKLTLRFGVPWTVYQNNAFMTQYRVFVQLDYFIN